ncbi:MAG: hypothetical protein V7L01_24155 [Nostoc sp.]|uniref:hypothetical protein n=1 Tax=Nostoc sp. TaxID=1180 RepID=UPI002FF505BF
MQLILPRKKVLSLESKDERLPTVRYAITYGTLRERNCSSIYCNLFERSLDCR